MCSYIPTNIHAKTTTLSSFLLCINDRRMLFLTLKHPCREGPALRPFALPEHFPLSARGQSTHESSNICTAQILADLQQQSDHEQQHMITGASQSRWGKESAADGGSQASLQNKKRQVPVVSLLKQQLLGEQRHESMQAEAADAHCIKDMLGDTSTDSESGGNMADTVAKAAFVLHRCVSEIMVGHAGKERTMNGRIDKKNTECIRQAAVGLGRQYANRDSLIQRTKSCPRLRVQSMHRALPV
jgi:hypothetical protein